MRPYVVVVLLALATAPRSQQSAAAQPTANAVDVIATTVSDRDRATKFFTTVLDFVVVDEREIAGDAEARVAGVFGLRGTAVRLRLGDEQIELHEYSAPRGRPFPSDTKSNDRWFQHIAIIVSDMDRAYARLRANHVQHASPEPQTLPAWNANAGGIRAFYFRDPDGHFLELLQFPPGKGEARWQRKDALFLGIDHTAIVVADTDASLTLYRDVLGMRVVGSGENWGPEQERLNSVFGARLRITTLRAGRGPAVELLEYLAPGAGRPTPLDATANDLAHWHVTLRVTGIDDAFARLVKGRARFVSPGPIELSSVRALSLRDLDGHALHLVEPIAVTR